MGCSIKSLYTDYSHYEYLCKKKGIIPKSMMEDSWLKDYFILEEKDKKDKKYD